ncbi:MAG: hypothetical protein R6U44_11910 [Archaeoglobaceae archaeon]
MAKVFGRLESRILKELKADMHRIERLAENLRAQRVEKDIKENYTGPKFKLFKKLHKRSPESKYNSNDYLKNYENSSEEKLYRLYNQMRFTHLGINRDDLTPRKGQ